MKKAFLILLVLTTISGLTGCETLQRKFTRKSKEREPAKPRFYSEAMSETRPNLDLYMMHYVYWKTWQEELMVKAGQNAKRDSLAVSEAIGNLLDMKKYLLDEKAKELDTYIEQVKKITDEIASGGATAVRLGSLKQKLGNIKARIVRRFYYKKVIDYIKPDKIGGAGGEGQEGDT